jgi:hypothetical protein
MLFDKLKIVTPVNPQGTVYKGVKTPQVVKNIPKKTIEK